VGANFGMYCFHLSRAVGPRGAVHAFEPVPATCVTLRRVARLLGLDNVRIVEAGASDAAGAARMALPRRGDGSADTGKAWAIRAGAPGPPDAVGARMVRLDEALDRVPVTFVKCDVEGAELFALGGATGLLERQAPTLVLETSRPAMSRYGVAPEELQSLLAELGYATYRYREGRLHPSEAGDLDANLVAVHPRRAERVRKLLP
jgi:FkbM family methyltransferase